MWPLRMQGLFFMEIFVMDGVDRANLGENRVNIGLNRANHKIFLIWLLTLTLRQRLHSN